MVDSIWRAQKNNLLKKLDFRGFLVRHIIILELWGYRI